MKSQAYNVVLMERFARVWERLYEEVTFAQEIGHNLGLVHGRQTILEAHEETPADTPHPDVLTTSLWDPLAFGYVDISRSVPLDDRNHGNAGTVMTYAALYLKSFSRPHGVLPRFDRESMRHRVGASWTDADGVLRRTAAAVASFYRHAGDGARPDDHDEDPPSTGHCVNSSTGEPVDRHRTAPLRGSVSPRGEVEVGRNRCLQRRQRGVPFLRPRQPEGLRERIERLRGRQRSLGVRVGTDRSANLPERPEWHSGRNTNFDTPKTGERRKAQLARLKPERESRSPERSTSRTGTRLRRARAVRDGADGRGTGRTDPGDVAQKAVRP